MLTNRCRQLGALVLVLGLYPGIAEGQLRSEVLRRGDTTVVRTLGTEPAASTRRLIPSLSIGRDSGPPEYVFGRVTGIEFGVSGTVWIFDSQALSLRQYDSTGKFIRAVGRGGRGPGEYGPAISLAFPHDGSTIIVDNRMGGATVGSAGVGNPVYVFDSAGRFVNDWKAPRVDEDSDGSRPTPVLRTGAASVIDPAGRLFLRATVANAPTSSADSRPAPITGVIRTDLAGNLLDTLRQPTLGLVLSARDPGVPLTYQPREYWTFSTMGHFVVARSDRFQIHIVHDTRRVTRIERDLAPVPFLAEERTGAEFPRTKPAFNEFTTDHNGRIWVRLHVASERVVNQPSDVRGARGGNAGSVARVTYRETVRLFEVFSPNGAYLGRVELPASTYPPAIKGNNVWMRTFDQNDVPVVVKYSIQPPL